MSKYRAEQDIFISGWECGTEIALKMVVQFKMTDHYPASDNGPEEFPQPEIEHMRFFRKHEQVAVEIVVPPFIEDAFTDSEDFMSWLAGEARESDEYARDCAADARREEARLGDNIPW
jgi:hypothetical protein